MMYVATCPLRVSLFGGSTDNPFFVERYGRGSVISFTSNLKTYVTISQDKLGYNKQEGNLILMIIDKNDYWSINLLYEITITQKLKRNIDTLVDSSIILNAENKLFFVINSLKSFVLQNEKKIQK